MNRRAVSKRLRFEILKRDGYRCQYCGATPLDLPLHVDHVIPLANGGTNDPLNLVTACADCNGGKAAIPLSERRLTPSRSIREVRDQVLQIRAWLDAQKDVAAARAEMVEFYWEQWCSRGLPGTTGAYESLKVRIKSALERAGEDGVIEAMDATARKFPSAPSHYWELTCRYWSGCIRRFAERRSLVTDQDDQA